VVHNRFRPRSFDIDVRFGRLGGPRYADEVRNYITGTPAFAVMKAQG
jgi:hypothetical protein